MKKLIDFIYDNDFKIQCIFAMIFEVIFLTALLLGFILGFIYLIKTYF